MHSSLRRRETLLFYLSISPWLIGFILFFAGPMVISLLTSFTDWDLISSPQWLGLGNYEKLMQDPLFWQSIKVTSLYTLAYVPLDLAGGLLLALLVQPRIRGISFFRSVFYLPTIFSGVAFVAVWMWLLNPQYGLVNGILAWFGIQGPRWLLDPSTALWALVLMSFWGWGRSMVIFLGGLQAVPHELQEAAAIDGAGTWQRFLKITLPLLTPSIFFNLVLSIISTFQTFTNAFVATNGSPLNSTLYLVLYLYRQAFELFHMGYAAALAWALFGIIILFTVLLFRSQQFWVVYLGGGRE